jgi:serine protease Do
MIRSYAQGLAPDILFEKVSPSVWVVQTSDAQGRPVGRGSAVVTAPGRLVTNCHVLAKSNSFVVKRDNVSYGATLEFPDPERDLCQIKVANFTAPPVELADIGKLRVGAKVYAIGNPRGLEVTLSDGLISGLRKTDKDELEMVQTTAPISPGSSGGGLFDAEGRLVGITTALLRDSQNLNFAVPANWIVELAGITGHGTGTMSYATVMVLRTFIHSMWVAFPALAWETACPQQGSICARSKTSYVSNSMQGCRTNALPLP